MKRLIIVLPIIMLMIPFGCTRTMSCRLKDVESYIQESPDSALVALQAIDTTKVKTKPQRALYSLLTAMSNDKNDIVMTDIQLIEPAITWYERHKQGDHLTAALFYSGRIHYSSGDYPSALISFQKAREVAGSIYWKGMCESHMALTFNACYNNEEELLHALNASELWKEYGDLHREQQSYTVLAAAYNNNRLADKADSLLALLCDSEPPYYPAFSQRAELKIRWDNPDYKEISSLFETALHHGCALSQDNWYEYAYSLYKCNERHRAESIINQLSLYGESISSCLWLGRIAEEDGDYKHALQYERTEKQLTDTIVKTQLSQSLFKAQAEQYRLSSELASRNRDVAVLMVILSFLLFAGVILWVSNAFKVKRERLEVEKSRAIAIAEKANEMLYQAQISRQMAETKSSESDAKLVELRRSFAQMYQRQFSEIGRLFDYSNRKSDISERATDEYLRRTYDIIEEIKSGEELQQKFEARINQDLDNIMIKLRQDFPDFKESDFRFLSYVIVGFDATTRAIILNETPNNMRVKKARLIKKIDNSNTENRLLYSCFLH